MDPALVDPLINRFQSLKVIYFDCLFIEVQIKKE